MHKPKMIPIQLETAKKLVWVLGKWEEASCFGCAGGGHTDDCPAREAFQLRNYVTQRINNPDRNFTV